MYIADNPALPIRRFMWIVALVTCVGVATAVLADGPWFDSDAPFINAAREIGGALVAGAVVGGLVLWFEERREDERVEREEARDNRQHARDEERAEEAARAAWQRELDFQLVRLIHGELANARDRRLHGLHEAAVESEGRTHTPELLEHFRRISDRTPSDLVVRQIIEVLNLVPQAVPERVALMRAVMSWNTHDFTVGGTIMARNEFSQIVNVESSHWERMTGALNDYLLRHG